MLSEDEIARILHASRIAPVEVDNPHRPLGLEQLAAAVSQLKTDGVSSGGTMSRPIRLPKPTWEKLDQFGPRGEQRLARTAFRIPTGCQYRHSMRRELAGRGPSCKSMKP